MPPKRLKSHASRKPGFQVCLSWMVNVFRDGCQAKGNNIYRVNICKFRSLQSIRYKFSEQKTLQIFIKFLHLHIMLINMPKKQINRLKVVLAEQGRTNKWLAEELNKNETTVSRWCTNEAQPSLETFAKIAQKLNVRLTSLFNDESNY